LATVGRISPLWACGAIGIGFTATCAFALLVAAAADKISPRDLFMAVLSPLGPVLVMTGAVLLMRTATTQLGLGAVTRLSLEITAGGIVYAGAAVVLVPKLSRDLISKLRSAFARRTMTAGARLEASNE